MKSWDIVAYTFKADIICPACITKETNPTATPSIWNSVEDMLDATASSQGIDRYDERSYDSGTFPKVVFADMIEDAEYCGDCHERILG